MSIKSITFVTMTALSLAACGSNNKGNPIDPNSPSTGTTTGSTGTTTGAIGTNPADPNGASVLSTNSPVSAATSNGNIALPYVIFAANPNATDQNKIYGIQFSDYDPCTQGSEYGWSSWPSAKAYNSLGFYFPNTAAPAAGTYNVGTGAADIQSSLGALGENFTAQPADANNVIVCKATTWDGIASGSVQITAADGSSVTGIINITLQSGAVVSGNFQSGSCSATATGAVSDPNATGQCTQEK